VSDHYADTYASDIATYCLPKRRSYNPNYKYHDWLCAWRDRSDRTRGIVQITGSGSAGAYYGRVVVRAH
jgi:hypothetical protein